MKRFSVLVLCLAILMVTACEPMNTIPATEESSVSTSSIPSTTSSSTTVATTTEYTFEEYIPEYDIDQTVLNVNFEDIYDLCEAWTGVDLDELVETTENNTMIYFDQEGFRITYIPDYSQYLESLYMVEPESGALLYYPEEYELHILRRLCINGFAIDEFEDDYWAEIEYCKAYDYYSDETCILTESDLVNGYFYSYEELTCSYYTYYVSDNCVLNYYHSLNQPDISDFTSYIEVCELTGLPTCSEMTEAIIT